MVSKSILLFLLVCIPLRILFAISSQYVPMERLNYFGILLLFISMSFAYLFITNSRLYSPEAGGKTWWAPFRLDIGLFYFSAAVYAFMGMRHLIWIPLAIDIVFGLLIFTAHHLLSWNP